MTAPSPDNQHRTINLNTSTLLSSAICVIMLACGPNNAADLGDSFGETGGGEEIPDSLGMITCVEMSPDAVTCWVDWGVAWARVLLPCTVAGQISAGTLGPGYDSDLPYWGPVVCHDNTLGDGSLCLYGDSDVLLVGADGEWVPDVSALVGVFDEVAPPCGEVACDGETGCECSAGECAAGLVCDFSEHCSPCAPGDPGCPCAADGFCEVGSCTTGQDTDGTDWSICYPADLLSCATLTCPGDAHCTDDLTCAWRE